MIRPSNPRRHRPAQSTIIFLARALFSLALFAPIASAADVVLTEEERVYLDSTQEVTFCVDPDWAPFESIDKAGGYFGIGADLLQLVANRVGMKLRLVETTDWQESMLASRRGDCALINFVVQSPERDEWLIFTDPLLNDVNVFITREEHPFIVDLVALAGETIALPDGVTTVARIQNDFPNLNMMITNDERTAFEMVSERRADLTMRSLIVAAYTIKTEGWFNLKIAGQAQDYNNLMRIGVSGRNTMLRNILNKGIATITEQERNQIVDSHILITVTTGIDYTLVRSLIAGFSIILLTSLFWILRLRKLNTELRVLSQTDTMTGMYNRSFSNVLFQQEINRVRRFSHELSVVILDVDHFKKINDEQGHLTGDKVLVEVAQIIRECARQVDIVSRWGGEEFLIVCPETTLENALVLAERIVATVRQHRFSSGRPTTISAGVASLRENESMDGIVQRADDKLYEAKSAGRDRVCCS